jgi:4-amino-4-deoxy-L-arabinose transferase-like glycosyltransferase
VTSLLPPYKEPLKPDSPPSLSQPPYLQWLALGTILLLGAGLRLWQLDQNGYGTEYYAAGVRSMMNNWHNFLYNAFDPAGFVSLDKPPLAFWFQGVSVKLFGFSGLSLIVPQVLAGLGSIVMVHILVRHFFGIPAGLLSAFFLSLTPIAVAADRSNNSDSWLVLFILAAAWALLHAADKGSRVLLILSMILIGVGFNVKMMAAFVVLPAFVLVYFLGAPLPLKRRIFDLIWGGLILTVVSLLWVLFFDLTPPESRPYAGSSRNNSMFELTFGHNAIGRFVRRDKVRLPEGTRDLREKRGESSDKASPRTNPDDRLSGRWSKIFVRVPVGPLRLADRHLAAQVAWLFPLALIGLLATWPWSSLAWPFNRRQQSLLLWCGWAISFGVVYSYAGGIFHFYYLTTLGPPLAALAGIGLTTLWSNYREKRRRALLLPAALLSTAAWEIYIQYPYLWGGTPIKEGWITGLVLILMIGSFTAAAGLWVLSVRKTDFRRKTVAGPILLGFGVLSLQILPGAWALSSVVAREVTMLPSADLSRLLNPPESSDLALRYKAERKSRFRKLVIFLKTHYHGERFLLATSSARLAAPIIVRTGEPVMAMGGFHGLDPILTPDKLAGMVKENQVRFFMVGDFSLSSRIMGAAAAQQPLTDWVRKNGQEVDPVLWGSLSPESDGIKSRLQLFDLRPSSVSGSVRPGEEQ